MGKNAAGREMLGCGRMRSALTRDESLFAKPRHGVRLEDCLFYHTMDLPGFGTVPGGWDLRGAFAIGNVDLYGKSVLDVGTASGFLSFSAEQAGAKEVVSFDIDIGDRQHLLPFKDSLYYRDHARWAAERTAHFDLWKNAYWLAHGAYGSHARAVYGDVYNLPPGLGMFDVAIICAVMDHMSDPIRAMASIARHVPERLVLGVWIPTPTEDPIAWFLGSAERPEGDAVFWAYSISVYRQVLGMLGFVIESAETKEFAVLKDKSPRTTIVARRVAS